MERYFVKAPISGWHEVDKEHYCRFVEHLKINASGVPAAKKEQFIKSRTKVVMNNGG